MAKEKSSRLARRLWASRRFSIFLGFPPKASNFQIRIRADQTQPIRQSSEFEQLQSRISVPSILHSCLLLLLLFTAFAWPVLESTRTTSNGLRRRPLLLRLRHKPPPPLLPPFHIPILLRSSSTIPAAMPPMRYSLSSLHIS